MDTAKVFETGRSQAVRLPKKYRFDTDEVIVQKIGSAVMLIPKEQAFSVFMEGLTGFSDDFMANGREQGVHEERDAI